jgi:dipeptidyl aminopeptidase/acylaminoacyl peptidase
MGEVVRRSVRGAFAALWCGSILASASAGTSEDAASARTQALQSIVERAILPAGISQVKLSPDGKKVAMLSWVASKETGRKSRGEYPWVNTAVVMDIATLAVTPILVPTTSARYMGILEATSVTWISNEQLAVNTNFGECIVFGVDGKQDRTLGQHLLRVVPAKDGRDAMAIVGAFEVFDRHALHRVNLRTGEEVKVPVDLPGELWEVVFDSRGRLRAAVTGETQWLKPGAKVTTWYRHDETTPWQTLLKSDVLDDRWSVVAVPDDSDQIMIQSREGRDTWALQGYDAVLRKTTDVQVSHPTDDVLRVEEDGRADLLRVVTHGLKPVTYWFDADWQRIQRAVDAALPGAVNVLSGHPNGTVLIYTYSDRSPGRWLVLDTQHMRMKGIGGRLLKFDAAGMRPMETLTYAAPDGMKVPAYLTRPAGPDGARPMVVYIHGGPVARDDWEWNEDVQVLAAAGYAVLQPQFRGSSGFGKKFEVAGYRQWGLAMQDDITAGVQEMIRRGVADPQRICIYGGSYGGYAALWGLAKTPDLYRCGISIAGVSDIGERFTDWSDTNANKIGPEFMRFRIGDIATMKAQFDEVSPEKHADRIKVPVLVAHGENDRRVPIGHGQRMVAALEAAHQQVEAHWYFGEGHGFTYQADRKDFDLALLSFLDRHIGPASPMADRWVPVPAIVAGPAAASAPAAAASAP